MPDADPDRLVQCVKLKKELPGLSSKPIPTDLGDYIFENVSKEGWDVWLAESVKFINTGGWDLSKKEGTEKLLAQLRIWLGLEEGEEMQTAWTPEQEKAAEAAESADAGSANADAEPTSEDA